LSKNRTNASPPSSKSDRIFTGRPTIKTTTHQMTEGLRCNHQASSAKPRRLVIPRCANASSIEPAGNVLSRGQKALNVSGLSSATQPASMVRWVTHGGIGPVRASYPRLAPYTSANFGIVMSRRPSTVANRKPPTGASLPLPAWATLPGRRRRYIPSNESEAVTYLVSLVEQTPGIAERSERTPAATCSARTVLTGDRRGQYLREHLGGLRTLLRRSGTAARGSGASWGGRPFAGLRQSGQF